MRNLRVLLLTVSILVLVNADMYLHNPPGSNDRNRERNENRNNGNRLFDSQNNGKGGYPWRGNATIRAAADPLTYYTGSVLRLEWTNQHACGTNPNSACDVILQYACDTVQDNLKNIARDALAGADLPGLRDGYPDSATVVESDAQNPGYQRRQFSQEATNPTQNQDGTETISDNQYPDDATKRNEFYILGARGGVEFGMHENYDMYTRCKTTERNKGLYTADQKLGLNDARATRQNPNGARRGLECPEERDYYPYWNSALNPWHDIAVLTNNLARCDFFLANSPNVKAYGYCDYKGTGLIPIDNTTCLTKGGKWNPGTIKGGGAPDCQVSPLARDNHLGNAASTTSTGAIQADTHQPEAAHYLWNIPTDLAAKRCVLRIRYNISTGDYPALQYSLDGGKSGIGINSASNCGKVTTVVNDDPDNGAQSVDTAVQCTNLITATSVPLNNRPYVQVFPNLGTDKRLSIALNTNQAGRTFQDRSYVFDVQPRPEGIQGTIFNLNVRGRRGNIVQCYPAVEYDFVPNKVDIAQGDYLHIQFHGSDFNQAQNANNGEGWQYADRSNLIQMEQASMNFPGYEQSMFSATMARRWALLDQTNCSVFTNGQANEQNSILNCGKLNSAPNRFPSNPADGLLWVNAGTAAYQYVSTRNNNFSNRSQKGQISVAGSELSSAEKAGIAVGSVGFVIVLVAAIALIGFVKPKSVAGGVYRFLTCKTCKKGNKYVPQKEGVGSSKTTLSPPDMDYTRH